MSDLKPCPFCGSEKYGLEPDCDGHRGMHCGVTPVVSGPPSGEGGTVGEADEPGAPDVPLPAPEATHVTPAPGAATVGWALCDPGPRSSPPAHLPTLPSGLGVEGAADAPKPAPRRSHRVGSLDSAEVAASSVVVVELVETNSGAIVAECMFNVPALVARCREAHPPPHAWDVDVWVRLKPQQPQQHKRVGVSGVGASQGTLDEGSLHRCRGLDPCRSGGGQCHGEEDE